MLQGEHSAMLLTFISYLLSLRSLFCLFLSGRFAQVLLYIHVWEGIFRGYIERFAHFLPKISWNCRSRGPEFDPCPVPYFRGDWSWNKFYGHSPPFRWFKKGCCQLQAKDRWACSKIMKPKRDIGGEKWNCCHRWNCYSKRIGDT